MELTGSAKTVLIIWWSIFGAVSLIAVIVIPCVLTKQLQVIREQRQKEEIRRNESEHFVWKRNAQNLPMGATGITIGEDQDRSPPDSSSSEFLETGNIPAENPGAQEPSGETKEEAQCEIPAEEAPPVANPTTDIPPEDAASKV